MLVVLMPPTASPSPSAHAAPAGLPALLANAKAALDAASVCGAGELTPAASPTMLTAEALGSGMPAVYRLMWEDGKLWVALQTKERYLSQSIEADLVHTGDKLSELIDEELAELGVSQPIGNVEHFRSQDKLYTFRSVVPLRSVDAEAGQVAATYVRAYEAAFRNLGDMQAGED
jgi:hypothetical protein